MSFPHLPWPPTMWEHSKKGWLSAVQDERPHQTQPCLHPSSLKNLDRYLLFKPLHLWLFVLDLIVVACCWNSARFWLLYSGLLVSVVFVVSVLEDEIIFILRQRTGLLIICYIWQVPQTSCLSAAMQNHCIHSILLGRWLSPVELGVKRNCCIYWCQERNYLG